MVLVRALESAPSNVRLEVCRGWRKKSASMRNSFHELWRQCTDQHGRCLWALLILAPMVSWTSPLAFAQNTSSKPAALSIQGTIRNAAGEPVAGASVQLVDKTQSISSQTETNADGTFSTSCPRPGVYTLRIQKSGFKTAVSESMTLSAGEQKHINFILEAVGAGRMEFEDKPNFTIAGVTDWTAAGGHGSDTNLRTSEALAKETLSLKSDETKENRPGSLTGTASGLSKESEDNLRAALLQAPGSFEANHQLGAFYLRSERYRDSIPPLETAHQIRPSDSAAAYDLALACKATGNFSRAAELTRSLLSHDDKADLHRLLGDLDEQLNDPLGAVHEYEQATRLDPSEQNYFEWGTELLLHRAIEPAVEVLGKGSGAHPKSARLLSAWGAALYASGAYDEAALRLCAASDLKPEESTPYLFLGKMENAAPRPLPCVEQKMARFVKDRPENPLANYHYALALWKRQQGANPAGLEAVKTLLQKAIAIDPRFDEGYLQLGILDFAAGDFEQAIRAYKRAIELNPRLGEAHYRLGVAYKRMGKETEAVQEFRAHEQIQKADAALVDRQRREVRQFVTVLRDQPEANSPR